MLWCTHNSEKMRLDVFLQNDEMVLYEHIAYLFFWIYQQQARLESVSKHIDNRIL